MDLRSEILKMNVKNTEGVSDIFSYDQGWLPWMMMEILVEDWAAEDNLEIQLDMGRMDAE